MKYQIEHTRFCNDRISSSKIIQMSHYCESVADDPLSNPEFEFAATEIPEAAYRHVTLHHQQDQPNVYMRHTFSWRTKVKGLCRFCEFVGLLWIPWKQRRIIKGGRRGRWWRWSPLDANTSANTVRTVPTPMPECHRQSHSQRWSNPLEALNPPTQENKAEFALDLENCQIRNLHCISGKKNCGYLRLNCCSVVFSVVISQYCCAVVVSFLPVLLFLHLLLLLPILATTWSIGWSFGELILTG